MVQRSFFKSAAGEFFGTSPFHVLGPQTYTDAPAARALWGATLTHVYKYVIDGERFGYVDSLRLSGLPVSFSWNLFGLGSPDRIVVPAPFGWRTGDAKATPCAGRVPALLTFADGPTADSAIRCVGKFEFTTDRLADACGFRRPVPGTSAVINGVLPGGEVAIVLARDRGVGPFKQREAYVAVLDHGLTRIVDCLLIGKTSPSNQFPSERIAADRTRLYLATDEALVMVDYDEAAETLSRAAEVRFPFRLRTGTTPTLLDAGTGHRMDRIVLFVDARCAVAKVFTGAIRCASGAADRPSRLVAIERSGEQPQLAFTDLPGFIDTVENSPSVHGANVVVANYSGYTPDGPRDGEPDTARGVVKLHWNPAAGRFDADWERADLQFNGVPTISAGSGLVYSSGAEDDGRTYFYGLALADGRTALRLPVGPAFASRRRARDQVFDAGNNTLINDDGSAIFPGGEVLVRIR